MEVKPRPQVGRTVPASELSSFRMAAGNEKKYDKVVLANGDLMEWVGIGWVNCGEATDDDKSLYPVVVD